MLLLEKAYAKCCGSYAALKSGWAYEAMIDLTGSPYVTIRLDDDIYKNNNNNNNNSNNNNNNNNNNDYSDGSNKIWKLILEYDKSDYIQSASTPGEDLLTVGGERRAKDKSTGLVAGHAYALLRAAETSTGNKIN